MFVLFQKQLPLAQGHRSKIIIKIGSLQKQLVHSLNNYRLPQATHHDLREQLRQRAK
jgi:hypothetical protein